ncbi:MAG: hypothetical protein WD971_04300 [Pirellulales bacterium]
MSVVRVGTTKKFADNWQNIFGGKKKAAGKSAPKSTKKVTAKLAGKKRSAKKRARLKAK